MGVLYRIIQRTPTVGIENRSSTTTEHGGSSQDYPTDSNSWNRKQEKHKNRTWGFFTGLSNGPQQSEQKTGAAQQDMGVFTGLSNGPQQLE